MADWATAKTLAPVDDFSGVEWASFLGENTDVFTKILGDMYRVYKSEEKRKAGLSDPRGGRRRKAIDGNIEELFSILEPKFSMLPFEQALNEIRGKKTVRDIASASGVSHGRIYHLCKNKRRFNRHDLEAIAKAVDVHPAYFCEWRSLVIHEAIDIALQSAPNVGITILKGLSRR